MFKKLALLLALSLSLSAGNVYAAKRGTTSVINTVTQTVINNTTTLWLGYHIANNTASAASVKVWSNASSTVTIIAIGANATANVNFKENLGVDYIIVATSMSVTQSTDAMTSIWNWMTY